MDRDRTRDGQYQFTLKRDVVIDNWSAIFNADMFIEKGTPTMVNDPFLYNSENMTFNQIKVGETLLKDSTTCG